MERISTAEAARRLGLSRATVRRRCASGELSAERDERPGGVVWWVVWTDAVGGALSEPAREPAHARGDERSERDALAVALRTIARLEHELDIAHVEKSQLLSALNARALSEPAREPAHARGDERPGVEPVKGADAPRRPWWKWWERSTAHGPS